MILYLLKFILCSAILIAAYKLMLEREKMHMFNRFYLLAAVIFSFIAPLISIEFTTDTIEPVEQFYIVSQEVSDITQLPVTDAGKPEIINIILIAVYAVVTLALFVRFLINVTSIYLRGRRSTGIKFNKAKLILLPCQQSSYSFLHYIFVNEEAYHKVEIMQHELAHVRQRHTIDIIFIEIVSAIAWMNPFLFLYKKSIRLNHEFLADEAVVQKNGKATSYQQLLLSYASGKTFHSLVSSFNFSITKKRLIMITKKTPFAVKAAKQIAVVILFLAVFAFFSTKMQAQVQQETNLPDTTKKTDTPNVFVIGPSVGHTEEGASDALMEEYATIVAKHWVEGPEMYNSFSETITAKEKARLLEIFKLMNRKQQVKQKVFFYMPGKPLVKKRPTQEQFNNWKNSKRYGVWIDDKRVSNEALNNYKASDFIHYSASRLAKNAVNYGKHYVQVNLMTNSYFAAFLKKQLQEQRTPRIAFMIRKDPKSK